MTINITKKVPEKFKINFCTILKSKQILLFVNVKKKKKKLTHISSVC